MYSCELMVMARAAPVCLHYEVLFEHTADAAGSRARTHNLKTNSTTFRAVINTTVPYVSRL